MAAAKKDLELLANGIQSAVADFDLNSRDGLKNIHDAMDKLRRAIDTPWMQIEKQRLHLVENMCIIAASEMGIFAQLTQNRMRDMSAAELANKIGFDELLVVRIMRIITGLGFADETGKQKYTANTVTIMYNEPGSIGTFLLSNEMMFLPASRIREFLRSQKPCDTSKIPPAYNFACGEDIWSSFRNSPTWKRAFDDAMTLRVKMMTVPWFLKYFPVDKLFNSEPDSSINEQRSNKRPVIVDVGGNTGADLQRLAEHYPSASCELINQDLPETIKAIDSKTLDPRVKSMVYDFFTEQPIRGADIYYLRAILHDWDDAASIKILSNTARAMNKDSRLLINEIVLSDTKESLHRAGMDVFMMFFLNGAERPRSQWKNVLARVEPPLQIVDVWSAAEDDQSVIEARLA